MYVARVPNRGSPPAILLRESYREDGKVKNRTLANLSRWPEEKVEALSAVLRGLPPKVSLEDNFEIVRSLPHGHVAAVLGALRRLGLEELIDPDPSRSRDLVSAMVVAQVIDPSSKLACARGLRKDTASSSWVRCSPSKTRTRTTSTRRWTGSAPARTRSRTPSRPATSKRARSCSMTSPRQPSRAGPVLWVRSAIPRTACADGCRSSMGCSPTKRGCPSRSRCSKATPAIRRQWPPR